MEMVKKIKAAKAPPTAGGAGLVQGDVSKYFAFGQTQGGAAGEERDKKHKKLKRDGEDGESESAAEKKKKKLKA